METTTGSYFWFVIFACGGGAVVLAGILMEVLSEKKWYRNINSFRRCESIRHWGEWTLIAGIIIEIVVAGFTARKEWAGDPIRLPVASVSAVVRITVRANKIGEEYLAGKTKAGRLTINKPGTMRPHDLIELNSESIHMTVAGEYEMSFALTAPSTHLLELAPESTSVKGFTNGLNCAKLSFGGFELPIEVSSGNIQLEINGVVPVNIPIPPQKCKMERDKNVALSAMTSDGMILPIPYGWLTKNGTLNPELVDWWKGLTNAPHRVMK